MVEYYERSSEEDDQYWRDRFSLSSKEEIPNYVKMFVPRDPVTLAPEERIWAEQIVKKVRSEISTKELV